MQGFNLIIVTWAVCWSFLNLKSLMLLNTISIRCALGVLLLTGVADRLFKRHERWLCEGAEDGYVKGDLWERFKVSQSLALWVLVGLVSWINPCIDCAAYLFSRSIRCFISKGFRFSTESVFRMSWLVLRYNGLLNGSWGNVIFVG